MAPQARPAVTLDLSGFFSKYNGIYFLLKSLQFSGRSLEMGLSYFLYLLAILSVSLGVLNLLPIPMLDGGHLVYYTYEILTGRELPQTIQAGAQIAGLAILGMIMIIAFYNDFIRIFS